MATWLTVMGVVFAIIGAVTVLVLIYREIQSSFRRFVEAEAKAAARGVLVDSRYLPASLFFEEMASVHKTLTGLDQRLPKPRGKK